MINTVIVLQLYDRISTRVPTPCRAPQTDAVQRAREVEELLREIEHSAIRNIDRADLRELHELLVQPHMRVSFRVIYSDFDRLTVNNGSGANQNLNKEGGDVAYIVLQ